MEQGTGAWHGLVDAGKWTALAEKVVRNMLRGPAVFLCAREALFAAWVGRTGQPQHNRSCAKQVRANVAVSMARPRGSNSAEKVGQLL